MSIRLVWAAALSVALNLVLPARTVAQEEPMTMAEAVSRALEQHPELARWEADARVHEAAAQQAAAHPNPELELEIEEWGIQRSWLGDEAEGTLAVRQAIPLSARLGAAAAMARSGRAVGFAQQSLVRNELVREVRAAFVRAAMAQQAVALARDSFDLSQAVFAAVKRRIEAGDLPPAELTRAEVEVLEAKLGLDDATALSRVADAELLATFGDSAVESLSLAPLGEPAASVAGADDDPSIWLAPAEAEAVQAEAAAELARAEAIPDLEVGLGWRESGGFETNSLVIAVGMPIPLWNRNHGAVDAARAEARRARFDRAAQERRWRGKLAVARARLAALAERYHTLKGDVLPALEAAHRTVLDGYAERRYDTLDLLASQRKLLTAQHRALEAREAYWLGRVDVEWLLGNQHKEMK